MGADFEQLLGSGAANRVAPLAILHDDSSFGRAARDSLDGLLARTAAPWTRAIVTAGLDSAESVIGTLTAPDFWKTVHPLDATTGLWPWVCCVWSAIGDVTPPSDLVTSARRRGLSFHVLHVIQVPHDFAEARLKGLLAGLTRDAVALVAPPNRPGIPPDPSEPGTALPTYLLASWRAFCEVGDNALLASLVPPSVLASPLFHLSCAEEKPDLEFHASCLAEKIDGRLRTRWLEPMASATHTTFPPLVDYVHTLLPMDSFKVTRAPRPGTWPSIQSRDERVSITLVRRPKEDIQTERNERMQLLKALENLRRRRIFNLMVAIDQVAGFVQRRTLHLLEEKLSEAADPLLATPDKPDALFATIRRHLEILREHFQSLAEARTVRGEAARSFSGESKKILRTISNIPDLRAGLLRIAVAAVALFALMSHSRGGEAFLADPAGFIGRIGAWPVGAFFMVAAVAVFSMWARYAIATNRIRSLREHLDRMFHTRLSMKIADLLSHAASREIERIDRASKALDAVECSIRDTAVPPASKTVNRHPLFPPERIAGHLAGRLDGAAALLHNEVLGALPGNDHVGGILATAQPANWTEQIERLREPCALRLLSGIPVGELVRICALKPQDVGKLMTGLVYAASRSTLDWVDFPQPPVRIVAPTELHDAASVSATADYRDDGLSQLMAFGIFPLQEPTG